jgi:glycine cleavage system aminomethyltransferase T
MNLDFLRAGGSFAHDGVIARSPMESAVQAAGGRFEVRDGWNVAVDYAGGSGDPERVGWADMSHLRTLELQADAAALDATGNLRLGEAVRADGAWWCRLTATRALVIGGTEDVPGALDVTSNFAAITLVGPLAREVLARFCALDLRPAVTPVRALRPGSIGRQPGVLIREAEDRYLFLFGWATGEYMWQTVTDAGEHLGGRPIGADALDALGSDSEAAQESVGA